MRTVEMTLRLKRWRQEKGLDGCELARELGVSASWVSKLERGRGRPKPSLARRIARVLGKPYLEVWRAVNEDYRGNEGPGDPGIRAKVES
jgi:transcriptional regulator with XRE-family HTH domain